MTSSSRFRCCVPAVFALAVALAPIGTAQTAAPSATELPPVLFNTAFEGASLGTIEKLGDAEFRLHVKGQQDARGRNRQATWFAFRMDDVAGRELTLRLTSFKGEYNDRPGDSTAGAWYRPVYSDDGQTWHHFAEAKWDQAKDELTVTLRPRGNTVWVAHVPPYSYTRLLALLAEIDPLPHARVEVIGRSVKGRDLHLVTVTNPAVSDERKKRVWLQARQHAWEAGTSFVMEGALKFIVSDDAAAQRLRDENVFLFTPMLSPDGVAEGEVRFNLNGWDPNRHWNQVDLRDERWLERAPEIWYAKKAILAVHAQRPIDIMLNLHNTQMNEYVATMVDADPAQAMLHRLFEKLVTTTAFDPSRPKLTLSNPTGPSDTTNVLWSEARVPVALMEQRIGPSRKLGRIMTSEDRVQFGAQLIALLAEVAR